ncbi:MAG: hypothetical protein ACOZBH_01340 [Patescibacteria group bacterium]
MKITICGSIAFFDEMQKIHDNLLQLGHEVKIPPTEIADNQGKLISVKRYYEMRKEENDDVSWIWEKKKKAMRAHFEKVEWADAILVLNYNKNGIENYIGANTFLEMGLAFHLGKTIYLLNPIPDISYKEELLAMFPCVINGDLTQL